MPEKYSFVKQRDMPNSPIRRTKRSRRKVSAKGREDDKLGMKVANIEERLRRPSAGGRKKKSRKGGTGHTKKASSHHSAGKKKKKLSHKTKKPKTSR